jgi:hypothetical protein
MLALLLSVGCVATVAVTMSAHAQESRSDHQDACARDVSRHCRKQMSDGDMVIFQCLKTNRDKLSPACRKVIDSH